MNQVLPKPKLLTDPHEIIIRGCRENDLQSQEQLYRLCYPDMIKICCRYAGDLDGAGIIYNNAMLKAMKSIQTYQHDGRLTAWIKTIVINCCLDFVKKQNKFRNKVQDALPDETVSIPEEAFSAVSVKEIQQLIQQLPKATATVFNLYIYEGFTHRQIGEALGISEGTSKWHVNEGRRLLKTKLTHFLNPAVKANADR
ncbi:MAG: sigma-70 family RNA polymerase sigma factor [Chitinophagaceae bacterium]|nr:sigma-70 family RNA polymerase sigma factor [Chitinophagaceae bacterium]